MTWHEKVIDLMKQNKITQKELSKQTGIAESSLSRYLRNENRPRLDIVINIAKTLGVEVDYFLTETDNAESAYSTIATAIARKGKELSPEEKNRLIALLLQGDV